jgi:signal transduction histidine kinase
MIITKKPLTILIIEDNGDDYIILKNFIERIKTPVEEILHSVNLDNLPDLVKNANTDLAFLSLSSAGSHENNPVEKLKYLLPNAAIICLSAHPEDEMAIKSMYSGAQDSLAKNDFNEKLLTKSIQYSLERKRLENELAAQYMNRQKLITETTLLAQEKERNEIGKELHDNINQILATVKLYHGMMKTGKNNNPDLLNKSTEYVNEAIEEIRKLSKSLVSPSLGNVSLRQALTDLVDEVNKTHALKINLNYEMDEKEKIGDSKELTIYRVVQEQMNNILKHSHAKNATIRLFKKDNRIFLTISDDGIGFDVHRKTKGIGIQNIKSRVEFYSGELHIISRPGEGCKFKIIIPC